MPFWHKLTLEHPSLSNPQHHTHKILMLQENVGVVWPFMKGDNTLWNHNPPIRCWPRTTIKTYRVQPRHFHITWSDFDSTPCIQNWQVLLLKKVIQSQVHSKSIASQTHLDPCNRQKVINFSCGSNLNGQAKTCMHPTLLMVWQVVLFHIWIFAVQVVPCIIEEEIMEHTGERKTFSTILQMKNRWKEVHRWKEDFHYNLAIEKSVKEVVTCVLCWLVL
jgi:hypothetical protein